MKKLKKNSGETIGEVLVSMLIISLSFLILAGAIVSSAKVNAGLPNEKTEFSVQRAAETSIQVTVRDARGTALPLERGSVHGYVTSGDTRYYYYEYDRD